MSHEEVISEAFPKFTKFVKENNKLVHLNLTAINLPNILIPDLICNIKRSTSLQCVHLCSNAISKENLYLMRLKLKPHYDIEHENSEDHDIRTRLEAFCKKVL
jgi:hypothetical protein